jgi:acetyl-CoA acetyltransferase
MSDAYVIGSFSTAFGKWTDKDHRALAREAVLGVLEDAGLADGSALA